MQWRSTIIHHRIDIFSIPLRVLLLRMCVCVCVRMCFFFSLVPPSAIQCFRTLNRTSILLLFLCFMFYRKLKSNESLNKMTISNGEQKYPLIDFDESKLPPNLLAEYRHLQQELQCQEALLVLMQKLKTNQKLISQNNHSKQHSSMPTTATKLSQQTSDNNNKIPLTATKQSLNNNNSVRPNPVKPPHPNQYTVNRSNQQSSKNSLNLSQATRQSNTNAQPTAATRLSSTIPPTTATKNSSNNSSKSNGVAGEQHLLNAKLALRKQLEQTLLQIPTPKPSTCDLTFIPGVNGWSEFLACLGLEQALNTFTDIVIRRTNEEISFTTPYVCAQCGTDWSVTWHEMSTTANEINSDEKILCDRCSKTSQKKLLKQDHSNRLRQAFIKALQQEKELDAKFQSSSPTTTPTSTNTNPNPPTAIKQSSSSASLSQQATKHSHQSTKSSSTHKTSSNHHHHHHHHNNNNNHHHHSSSSSSNSKHHNNNNNNHHHRQHSSKTSSSKSHHLNSATMPNLAQLPAETLVSTLAALQTNEQLELFQKHFLSNMLPFAVANQTAALAAKTTQQQQQQAAALAASLMRQPNYPAQYLLDMIPQAAKQHHQQQQKHHRHSK